ncbi:unnamed protein product [Gadus morhua 'NCC']
MLNSNHIHMPANVRCQLSQVALMKAQWALQLSLSALTIVVVVVVVEVVVVEIEVVVEVLVEVVEVEVEVVVIEVVVEVLVEVVVAGVVAVVVAGVVVVVVEVVDEVIVKVGVELVVAGLVVVGVVGVVVAVVVAGVVGIAEVVLLTVVGQGEGDTTRIVLQNVFARGVAPSVLPLTSAPRLDAGNRRSFCFGHAAKPARAPQTHRNASGYGVTWGPGRPARYSFGQDGHFISPPGFPAVFLFRCPTSSRIPSSLFGASEEGQPRLYEAGVEGKGALE